VDDLLQKGPYLQEGTDTLPRVGDWPGEEVAVLLGDLLSTEHGDPRPSEFSGKTRVQRVAQNSSKGPESTEKRKRGRRS
jgi:hypothetical protein